MPSDTETPSLISEEIEDVLPMKDFNCRECGRTFKSMVLHLFGRELLPDRACPDCVEAREAEIAMENSEQDNSMLRAEWIAICPPLYRKTDRKRLSKPLLNAVDAFEGNDSMGIVGKPGAGKTRAAFLALKRMHLQGKRCAYINGSQFNAQVANKAADFPELRDQAHSILRNIRDAQFLLLDDVGKQRFTSASEQELYDLLEHRTSFLKPIIWTTNSTAKDLQGRISKDRGDAVIRRLTEDSKIVKV